MSQAYREALWAREKAERTPASKRENSLVDLPAHAARVQRAQQLACQASPAYSKRSSVKHRETLRGHWCVVYKNDDGRERVLRRNLSPEHADKVAGKWRDTMSDADVDAGWNALSRRMSNAEQAKHGRAKSDQAECRSLPERQAVEDRAHDGHGPHGQRDVHGVKGSTR